MDPMLQFQLLVLAMLAVLAAGALLAKKIGF